MIANMGTAQAYNIGGMDAGAINRQYVKDMRIHEIQSRPNKKNSAIVQPKTALQERTIPDVTAYIKTINFVNNKNIPTEELSFLVKDKIDKPMKIWQISEKLL